MTPRIGISRNIFSFFCLKFQKGKLFGNHNVSHFRKNPHLEQKSLFPREVPTLLPTVVGRSSKAAGLLTATCAAHIMSHIWEHSSHNSQFQSRNLVLDCFPGFGRWFDSCCRSSVSGEVFAN